MFKLVRSPDLAAKHLPSLLPGVTRIYESAAFPEIRAFAEDAKNVLETSVVGAVKDVSDETERKQLLEEEAYLLAQQVGVAFKSWEALSLSICFISACSCSSYSRYCWL